MVFRMLASYGCPVKARKLSSPWPGQSKSHHFYFLFPSSWVTSGWPGPGTDVGSAGGDALPPAGPLRALSFPPPGPVQFPVNQPLKVRPSAFPSVPAQWCTPATAAVQEAKSGTSKVQSQPGQVSKALSQKVKRAAGLKVEPGPQACQASAPH